MKSLLLCFLSKSKSNSWDAKAAVIPLLWSVSQVHYFCADCQLLAYHSIKNAFLFTFYSPA